MASSIRPYGNKPHMPGSNGPPTRQAPSQITVYPDYDRLKKSYSSKVSTAFDSSDKKKGGLTLSNYFSSHIGGGSVSQEMFNILEYDVLFCEKKSLLEQMSSSRTHHISNNSDVIKAVSSLNEYCFNSSIDSFFIWLNHQNGGHYNEKYISELVSMLIQPLGTSMSKMSFDASSKGSISQQPHELTNSGTVSLPVRQPGDSLKLCHKVRFSVPTPSQWNNAKWYVKGRDDVIGKITLFAEPVTIEKDEMKFRQLFTGFFGNDSFIVESCLKEIIDNGNASILPAYAVPKDLLNLISTIYIDTTEKDIASGTMVINHKFKFNSLMLAINNIIESDMNNNGPDLNRAIDFVINSTKEKSLVQTMDVLASVLSDQAFRFKMDFKSACDLVQERVNIALGPGVQYNVIVFHRYHYIDDINFKLIDHEGLNEQQWFEELEKHGDEALDWSNVLYHLEEGAVRKPLTPDVESNKLRDNFLGVGMFGDYSIHVENSDVRNLAPDDLSTISSDELIKQRKMAAENWAICASQVFGLSIPTSAAKSSSDRMECEGFFYHNHKNPDFEPVIRDSQERAQRLSLEIARTLMSAFLPNEIKERYVVGFDSKTGINPAMKMDQLSRYTFDTNNDLGKCAKEISTVFPDWTAAMAEYFNLENKNPKVFITEQGSKGNRAVGYMK